MNGKGRIDMSFFMKDVYKRQGYAAAEQRRLPLEVVEVLAERKADALY